MLDYQEAIKKISDSELNVESSGNRKALRSLIITYFDDYLPEGLDLEAYRWKNITRAFQKVEATRLEIIRRREVINLTNKLINARLESLSCESGCNEHLDIHDNDIDHLANVIVEFLKRHSK